MLDHLSSSQINLYLQCSLKYKFQYIDSLPKPFKPSGLAFGSVIHSALSWFHKEKMNGNGVTLERLYKIFDADWYSQKADTEIHYKDGEAEMNLIFMAKEMLRQYLDLPHKKIMGSEVPFAVPIVNLSNGMKLSINLEGFIDLIEDDGTIVEFKTSNQSMNQNGTDDHLQLTAYSYAYEMFFQSPPKLLKVVNFVKIKKPKIIVFETKRGKSDYQRFFHLASKVLDGVKGKIFFPRQTFMCKDCEYDESCKEWGG